MDSSGKELLADIEEMLLKEDELRLNSPESVFQYEDRLPDFDIETTILQPHDKTLDFWNGVALVIGSIIGSGIFASPGLVLFHTNGNTMFCIGVWILSGVLSLFGAFCYAELGTMLPDNGGDLPYLEKAFGPLPAFSFAYAQLLVIRPASLAIIAITSAQYVSRLLGVKEPDLAVKVIAILLISMLTALNAFSSKASTDAQSITTIFKLLSLTAIGFCGLYVLAFSNSHPASPSSKTPTPGQISLALYSSLWAFDGWNTLNSVTAELDNYKDLPAILMLSISLITAAYVTTNLSYFSVLENSVIMKSNAVGIDWGIAVLGNFLGSLIISIVVVISTLGAMNASIFAGSKVFVVAAEKKFAPSLFLSGKNALAFQFIASMAYVILAANMKSIINSYSIVVWVFYFLTVGSLLLLRLTHPFINRPFTVWLPIPIIFCILALC